MTRVLMIAKFYFLGGREEDALCVRWTCIPLTRSWSQWDLVYPQLLFPMLRPGGAGSAREGACVTRCRASPVGPGTHALSGRRVRGKWSRAMDWRNGAFARGNKACLGATTPAAPHCDPWRAPLRPRCQQALRGGRWGEGSASGRGCFQLPEGSCEGAPAKRCPQSQQTRVWKGGLQHRVSRPWGSLTCEAGQGGSSRDAGTCPGMEEVMVWKQCGKAVDVPATLDVPCGWVVRWK